jgi:hypothetical protein
MTTLKVGRGGFSEAAASLDMQMSRVRQHLRNSRSLGWGEDPVLDDLAELAHECQLPNWDCYGALPVSEQAIAMAKQFLKSLPIGVKAPAIGASPAGNVTFEWYRSVRNILSVSITPIGEIHYAALQGLSSTYGTEMFYDETPAKILGIIDELAFIRSRGAA